jgi:arginyl-tRNA synthetase
MKTPLLKSDGTSLYLSRDIAAGLDRILKYKCDKIVYVVDKSQSDHMELLKKTVNKVVGKCVVDYITFGRVIGMSTRKGNSIFLSDILDIATKKMAEQQATSPSKFIIQNQKFL